MGMSNAAVFIKLQNSEELNIKETIKELFGEYTDIKSKWEGGFDFRNSDSIVISLHENGIRIMNSEFVNKVLIKRSPETIQKLYAYFNSPKLMMAYMHYDSGDTFGYGCIEEGIMKRFRYSVSTDWVTHDFGHPYDEELNILNGQIYYEEDEYGDREYLYRRLDDPSNPRSYHFINSEIANEVMKNKIGFGFYDENVEAKSYYITLKSDKKQVQQNPIKTKSKGIFGKLFGN
jgi:hypothetical protein